MIYNQCGPFVARNGRILNRDAEVRLRLRYGWRNTPLRLKWRYSLG